MDRGATALVSRMKTAAGRPVVYTRKSDGATIPALTAWVGNSNFDRQTNEGTSVISGERDYLCELADLVIDGTRFFPARGDRITETIAGTAYTFEIAQPANNGEPPWRYSEQTRLIARMHMKRV